MSATGRKRANGTATVRDPLDYYRTPAYAIDAILPHLREPRVWLDPGCGDGAIAERVIARWPSARGIGVELDAARAQAASARLRCPVWRDDFLRRGALWEPDGGVDLVIGNPPYKQALEFLRRSLELVAPTRGEVAFLLRVGFLEAERGSERDELLEEHPPDVYLLAKRPRFRGDGGGDATTYAWCRWWAGSGTRFCRLRSPGRAA